MNKIIVNTIGMLLIMIALCSLNNISVSNWEYWALLIGLELSINFNLDD